MNNIMKKINSSEITNEQGEMLTKVLFELELDEIMPLMLELKDMISLNGDIQHKNDPTLRFVYKEVIINDLKQIRDDFNEEYHDFLVDFFDIKDNIEYYRYGIYTHKWANFLLEKIEGDYHWAWYKARYKFDDYERFKDDFPNKTEKEITSKIADYISTEAQLNGTTTPCVYFIKGDVNGQTKYKIGKADNLKNRFSQLQKEYDFDLFICNTIDCPNPLSLEFELHKHFYQERRYVAKKNGSTSNEWFDIDQETIKKYLKANFEQVK